MPGSSVRVIVQYAKQSLVCSGTLLSPPHALSRLKSIRYLHLLAAEEAPLKAMRYSLLLGIIPVNWRIVQGSWILNQLMAKFHRSCGTNVRESDCDQNFLPASWQPLTKRVLAVKRLQVMSFACRLRYVGLIWTQSNVQDYRSSIKNAQFC